MKNIDIIKTSSSNLLRNKMRTLLTIIAIFVGAFTLTLTSALGSGITTYMDDQVSNLGQEKMIFIIPESTGGPSGEPELYDPNISTTSGSSGYKEIVFTKSDVEKISKLDSLTNIEPFVGVSPDFIQGKNDKQYTIPISPIMEDTNFELIAGKTITKGDPDNLIIIPDSYVNALGYSNAESIIGQEVIIGVSNQLNEEGSFTAKVSGVLSKGIVSSSGAIINNSLKNKIYDYQTMGLPPMAKEVYFAIFAEMTGEYTDENAEIVKKELEELGYVGTTVKDQIGVFDTVIKALTYILNGFALIALIAAGFGIVNTLLMSVQERTKEIGLMKSMGMNPKKIFMLFSIEAILIGFWGSLIGVLGAVAAGLSINNMLAGGILKDLPGLNLFAYPPSVIAFTMILIMSIAFIAGALPARRASKLDPINALRHD